jgi:hypothetical protein
MNGYGFFIAGLQIVAMAFLAWTLRRNEQA